MSSPFLRVSLYTLIGYWNDIAKVQWSLLLLLLLCVYESHGVTDACMAGFFKDKSGKRLVDIHPVSFIRDV